MNDGLELTPIPSPSTGVPQINGPFKEQASQNETEHMVWGRGPLRTFDVVALIVNKMVGIGIYTTPATVYSMTGNKSLTLGLFGIGFIYSLASMAIYLGFAKVLPFNGGELIYLEEITSYFSYKNVELAPPAAAECDGYLGPMMQHPNREPDRNPLQQVAMNRPVSDRSISRLIRWMKSMLGDGLFAFILYSIFFVVFFNSATSAMQFGRMVLLCITADEHGKNHNSPDVNNDLMRFIGVAVVSVICFLQYFSPEFGRKLNRILAVVKIGFLVGLFFVGLAATSRKLKNSEGEVIHRAADWGVWQHEKSKLSFAKAFLAVIFSFEGWENATFVTGEIPRDRHRVLHHGFVIAVFTVGVLYLLVIAVVLNSITWDNLTADNQIFNYPPMLTGNGTTARRAWSVIGAISSFGSINAIIYTFSRVKQVIGQADILPWSRFLKQDDILQRNSGPAENEFVHKSPQGGLIAHWVMGVVVLSSSASLHSTLEAASLPGYIQTYLHCFVLMLLGFGYLNLKSRQDALDPEAMDSPPDQVQGGIARAALIVGIGIYALLNFTILIANPIPPYTGSEGGNSAFQGYGFSIILLGLLIVGTGYYLLFFGAAPRCYPAPLRRDEDSDNGELQSFIVSGIVHPESRWNLMRWANVRCEIRKDYFHNTQLERVYRFGRRWRIVYFLPIDDGAPNTPETWPQGPTFPMFLYWAFGGSRLEDDWNPWMVFKDKLAHTFSWPGRTENHEQD